MIPGLGRSPGGENGNPLQYFCLENSMNRGAWRATVHRVAKSRTRLSDFTFTFTFYCLRQGSKLKKISSFDPCIRKIPWRRKWQPTPVFLPGKSQGQKSLAGYSPWGRKESDTTEQLSIAAVDICQSQSPRARDLHLLFLH